MKKQIIAAIGLGLLGATLAHADTVFGELQVNSGNVLPSPIIAVSDDLLQTSFGSVTGGASDEAILRDGLTGTAKESDGTRTGLWISDGGGSLETTYFFDLSTNINGYDIEEFRVFTGWEANRAQAGYDIYYSAVGDASFRLLGTVSSPGDQGIPIGSGVGAFMTRTYDSLGDVIVGLTGIDAIRFKWDFSDNVDGGNRGPVFREIDVIGTPVPSNYVSIPEPSTTPLLVGMMTLSLAALRRRR